jgi:hypothetical protein
MHLLKQPIDAFDHALFIYFPINMLLTQPLGYVFIDACIVLRHHFLPPH